jgi:curli biogenesis system outer membrane secretion channel CsgG
MKQVASFLSASLLTLICSVAVLAQNQAKKPIVGIKTFENPPVYANSTIGNGLTDLFTTHLMNTDKYTIIERAALGELVQEVDLGRSGYVDQKSAVRKGHIKGLEYLFVGKVTNFGEREKKTGLGGIGGSVFGGLGLKKSEAYVRIDFRIVDSTTGEVLYAGYGEGEDKTKGISFGGGVFGEGAGAVDMSTTSFLESMVGRATLKAIDNVIEKMDHNFLSKITSGAAQVKGDEAAARQEAEEAIQNAPGKILAVVSDQLIIISLGAEHGLKLGDKLNVFKLENVKDSNGNVVFSEEKQIGVLTVTEVQPDRSKAAKASGAGLTEGMVIRKQ